MDSGKGHKRALTNPSSRVKDSKREIMGDLISQLPDALLQHILLNLTTRESVRTSVLSTRWRNLWQHVPGLHLIYGRWDRGVKDCVNRFLNLHQGSPIYQFTFYCNAVKDDDDGTVYLPLRLLIDRVVASGVQCFAIDCITYYLMNFKSFELPLTIHMCQCETLVHLVLHYLKLGDFDDCEFFHLPRLKTMHIESVDFPSDLVLEMLISCSPVLQDLSISYITVGLLKVRSQTLKNLSTNIILCLRQSRNWDNDEEESGLVVIDTPSLEFLCIRKNPLENFRVESVSSSIKVCIDIIFDREDDLSKMQTLHKFFAGISEVTHLSISANTLDGIYPYSKLQQLPQFQNLTHLHAIFCSSFSEMFPLYLSSCPNLKSIDLELDGHPNMEEIASSPVPQCLQTSIEYVKIKMIHHQAGEERNPKAATEFAKYILENAIVLQELSIWLDEEEDVCSSVLREILTFRKCALIKVKMNRVPAKFKVSCKFESKPFHDWMPSFARFFYNSD